MIKQYFQYLILYGVTVAGTLFFMQPATIFAGDTGTLTYDTYQVADNNNLGDQYPYWGYDLNSSKSTPAELPGNKNPNNKQIFIDAIVANEERILAGKVQLIQINLANPTKLSKRYDMRVRFIKPNGTNDYLPFKRVSINARSIEPFLYRYKTDPNLQGNYSIEVNLMTPGSSQPYYQLQRGDAFVAYLTDIPAVAGSNNLPPDDLYGLSDSDTAQEPYGLLVDPNTGEIAATGSGIDGNNQGGANGSLQNNAGVDLSQRESGLQREDATGSQVLGQNNAGTGANGQRGAGNGAASGTAAELSGSSQSATNTQTSGSYIDMEWMNLRLSTNSILRGETFTTSVYLVNNGREIAENVTYGIYLVRELNKDSYINITPIVEGNYAFIAPGETKLVNIPVTIDTEMPSGQYVLIAHVDPNDDIVESDNNNNNIISDTIFFNEIMPLDPENNITINSNSEITFSWRSNQYVLFQVQVSQDERFGENALIIQMPTTDPTPLNSITMLRGETEILKQQVKPDNNEFYWRIVGFDTQNNRVVSKVRKFYFNIIN